jgi:exopolyphosphatase/pppGpp-phosphohydrolase
MEAGRADIILPALIILLTLLNHLDIDTIQISVRGARYGILL